MKFTRKSILLAIAQPPHAFSQLTSFNITAISAFNNASRLECWQLAAAPVFGRGAVNFDLGDFDSAFVGILPPNTTSGTLSNAVRVQFVKPPNQFAQAHVTMQVFAFPLGTCSHPHA